MSNTKQFEVDDILIMNSPFTGVSTQVSYRGKYGDKAFVYDKVTGWQGAVPWEWLEKDTIKPPACVPVI
jgi:hypothetical protein